MFFFKQKTAYVLRISDWSSDVCSTDLPIAPTKLPSRSSRIAGVIDERGRLPPAIAFAAGTGPLAGFQEKSESWLLRKTPSTMRPDPKYDSIVVVIDTALPRASTKNQWLDRKRVV